MKYLTAMPNPSRFSGTFSWKQRLDGQIATNCVYSMIFTYIILFSIFNSVYIDLPSAPDQPRDYDIENVAVNPIGCSFYISGYYERTPRYICYLSLVLTVVIRNHKWLAAGAPTLILSYSGVAAIHLIILFATNNRLELQEAKSYCETLPTLGAGTPFVACAGVYDPDVGLSMAIVSTVMLGALPIVAWSSTFRKSKNKVILIFWLLLIAVGHTFYPLTESNPGSNFQICPKDHIEPLPTGFQAPFLDQSWRDSFSLLVSTAQQSSQTHGNGSSLACIYSCFATTDYSGRKIQDITVWDGVSVQNPTLKSLATDRIDAIIFWWGYILLAFLTFLTTEKKGWLPKWFHKLLFSIEYRHQLRASSWRWKIITNIASKGTQDSMLASNSSEATSSVKVHFTVLKVVQRFTQLVSVGVFCGSIIQQETQNAHEWSVLSQESFVAVGQWSNLALVLLVLVAARLRRIWARLNYNDTRSDYWRDNSNEHMETENDDWDWRIGYAS